MEPLFPRVRIDVRGPAGNALAVIGNIKGVLHEAGFPRKDIEAVVADMMSGDYNHLLAVAGNYVSIVGGDKAEGEEE